MAVRGRMNDGGREAMAEAPLRHSEYARYVRVDDQVIVADMRAGRYLGLEGVGARVWDLIGTGATEGAMLRCLAAEYDVAADVLARDVRKLVRELLVRRLIARDVP